jgi:dTDP-4-amino-4,6-dideoxygalactose transaminase
MGAGSRQDIRSTASDDALLHHTGRSQRPTRRTAPYAPHFYIPSVAPRRPHPHRLPLARDGAREIVENHFDLAGLLGGLVATTLPKRPNALEPERHHSRPPAAIPEGAPIPFNRPFIVGKELHYISQAVLGGHLAGDGTFTELCREWMEQHFNARCVLLTHSCTAALEMSALLCDVGPDDEVIMPSYTFVSTANAFALRGARIRFIDIRPDTLNIDETKIEQAISKRTKVIVPVHYAGVGSEMDAIMEIARRHNIKVVEDAAQGVDATYNDRHLGTIGHLGCYSFHETKNFISGEGGALVVNDPDLVERAQIVREKGTNRVQFREGRVDKYTWVDFGSSYLPSEIVAAFLYAQLEASSEITRKRRALYGYYEQAFMPLQERGLLRIPCAPPHTHHNAHMFYLIMPSRRARDGLLAHLAAKKIHAVFHYVPLHSSPMGRRLGFSGGELPVTDDISGVVRLPCFFTLERSDQDRVIEAVTSYV